MLRFGTDGVRGVALTELTTGYVTSLGAAATRVLGNGTWLIARDPRASGPALEEALVAGILGEGGHVLRCGVLPTPALAHYSALHDAPAAMVTASHNPYTDNGVKIFAAGGLKLSDDVEQQIEALLELGVVPMTSMATTGAAATFVPHESLIGGYVDHLVALFPPDALAGLRVVLDCANGAMSDAAPQAVRRLGADVIVINAEPDGCNINDHCGATDPRSLAETVLARGADAGLAFDGDGDRVIAIDNLGHVVDGDRLIAMAALQLRDEGELTHNTVVVTVMSNLGFHRAMHEAGIEVVTTAVGDRYVLETLAAGDFAIGGEQSGHVIYRHVATTGDGLLAGLKLLQRVAASGRGLADAAADVMTSFPQVLVNVVVNQRHPDIATEMAAEIAAVQAELGADGRVLVRASGTEELVRVMIEAASAATAQRLAEHLAGAVRRRFA